MPTLVLEDAHLRYPYLQLDTGDDEDISIQPFPKHVRERIKLADSITREQAEMSADKATPEAFIAAFDIFRAAKATIDPLWANVQSPVQPLACETCGKQDGKNLLVCGACKIAKYCSESSFASVP